MKLKNWQLFILLNLVLLAIPFLLILASYNPDDYLAGIQFLLIPWIHAVVCGICFLIFHSLEKPVLAKWFAMLAIAILLIGFTTCGILRNIA